ncbi:MAG: three-Cys-motif partner protein TcmP [Dehalococcoidales bacterium]
MTAVFDEIGYWSEIKLDIINQYAKAYSQILSTRILPNHKTLYHIYIDAFAGSGKHISRTTGNFVSGSPEIALNIEPSFKEFYFIDIDGIKVAELKKIVANRPEAHVLEGDCNERLLNDVFPYVAYKDYKRALCLLDPYSLNLNWEVMYKAGQMKSIEILLNFPVYDMNRNALWTNPENLKPSLVKRMNSFWGDDSWQKAAYAQQLDFNGKVNLRKLRNEDIAYAFKKRLKEVAGFAYVSQPLPMRNSNNAVVYYLFHASQQPVADKIIKDIFKKYLNWGLK